MAFIVISEKEITISNWVGPRAPPDGQASIFVTLGPVGNIVINGTIQDTNAVVDYAIDFEGAEIYADCGDIANWNYPISVNFWIYYRPVGRQCVIDSDDDEKDVGYHISVGDSSGGVIGYVRKNGNICAWSSKTNLISYIWNQVLFVFKDFENCLCFINGVDAGVTLSGDKPIQSIPHSKGHFAIGKRYQGSSPEYLRSVIDELTIYNADKSSSISYYWNNGKGRKLPIDEPDLGHGWHFDEGGGNIAKDFSEKEGDATLLNIGDMNWVEGYVKD